MDETEGRLPPNAAEDVEGLLAQSQAADKVLGRLPADAARELENLVSETFTHAFANSMYLLAGVALVALVVAAGLPELPRRR